MTTQQSICTADVQEAADMTLAKEIGDTLHAHYPGHMWAIAIQGGAVVIKNLKISEIWGMVIHYKSIAHDAAYRRRRVIKDAGELLERAHLIRGAEDGQVVHILEGVNNFKTRAH